MSDKKWREFWIEWQNKNGPNWVYDTAFIPSDMVVGEKLHVIEYAALEEAERDLELSCKANALFAEENKKLEAEIAQLKEKLNLAIEVFFDYGDHYGDCAASTEQDCDCNFISNRELIRNLSEGEK